MGVISLINSITIMINNQINIFSLPRQQLKGFVTITLPNVLK
jgi:hypothetical protein